MLLQSRCPRHCYSSWKLNQNLKIHATSLRCFLVLFECAVKNKIKSRNSFWACVYLPLILFLCIRLLPVLQTPAHLLLYHVSTLNQCVVCMFVLNPWSLSVFLCAPPQDLKNCLWFLLLSSSQQTVLQLDFMVRQQVMGCPGKGCDDACWCLK